MAASQFVAAAAVVVVVAAAAPSAAAAAVEAYNKFVKRGKKWQFFPQSTVHIASRESEDARRRRRCRAASFACIKSRTSAARWRRSAAPALGVVSAAVTVALREWEFLFA